MGLALATLKEYKDLVNPPPSAQEKADKVASELSEKFIQAHSSLWSDLDDKHKAFIEKQAKVKVEKGIEKSVINATLANVTLAASITDVVTLISKIIRAAPAPSTRP